MFAVTQLAELVTIYGNITIRTIILPDFSFKPVHDDHLSYHYFTEL